MENSHFAKLPGELRNEIYSLVFRSRQHIDIVVQQCEAESMPPANSPDESTQPELLPAVVLFPSLKLALTNYFRHILAAYDFVSGLRCNVDMDVTQPVKTDSTPSAKRSRSSSYPEVSSVAVMPQLRNTCRQMRVETARYEFPEWAGKTITFHTPAFGKAFNSYWINAIHDWLDQHCQTIKSISRPEIINIDFGTLDTSSMTENDVTDRYR